MERLPRLQERSSSSLLNQLLHPRLCSQSRFETGPFAGGHSFDGLLIAIFLPAFLRIEKLLAFLHPNI
jgi:hypothetical protein